MGGRTGEGFVVDGRSAATEERAGERTEESTDEEEDGVEEEEVDDEEEDDDDGEENMVAEEEAEAEEEEEKSVTGSFDSLAEASSEEGLGAASSSACVEEGERALGRLENRKGKRGADDARR